MPLNLPDAPRVPVGALLKADPIRVAAVVGAELHGVVDLLAQQVSETQMSVMSAERIVLIWAYVRELRVGFHGVDGQREGTLGPVLVEVGPDQGRVVGRVGG